VSPRKLILIRGTKSSIEELATHVKNTVSGCNAILTPRLGEEVDVTSDTNIFKIRLKDELLNSLDFRMVDDYELAWVDAVVKEEGDEMVLDLPDVGDRKRWRDVYVGDVKLANFVDVLRAAGIKVSRVVELAFLIPFLDAIEGRCIDL